MKMWSSPRRFDVAPRMGIKKTCVYKNLDYMFII